MAEAVQRKLIGDTARLGFDFSWGRRVDPAVEGLAWGGLVLWVGGRPVWSRDEPRPAPVEWTWVDLLDHVARAWGHLMYEENAPFGLVFDDPAELRHKGTLQSVAGHTAVEVEDAVHRFQHRHDLAAGLHGIGLTPVWILRQGRRFRIRAERHDAWVEGAWLRTTLEALAEHLIEHLGPAPASRAVRAIERWRKREPSAERRLSLRAGLDPATVAAWTPPGADAAEWWGLTATQDDSPVMAAARLSQPLKSATRRALIDAVRGLPRCQTVALDELTHAAAQVKHAMADHPAYAQGHAMADWLREGLAIEDDEPVDPERLLADWGVHLGDLEPLEPALDAFACWGEEVGPAVLVNPSGRHAGSAAGRRATLAHEIAHLLLDRGDALLAAEVFGGSTPLILEKRARAFAAEFLLPRRAASRGVAESTSLDEAVETLRRTFDVSQEVAYWQIKNGGGRALLTVSEREKLKRRCNALLARGTRRRPKR